MKKNTYSAATWLFIRVLGLTFVFAFFSFSQQMRGLIFENGILPVSDTLAEHQIKFGLLSFFTTPTLCWLNSSDSFISFLCYGGLILSLLVTFAVASGPCLFLCWLFYLSLVNVGDAFLAFQWDSLLLEAAFVSIFLRPWHWLDRPFMPQTPVQKNYSKTAFLLLYLLLFRLMVGSGIIKIIRGSANWVNFTAMSYYYQNQLLPAPLAWYAHQLPAWCQSGSSIATFFIELVVPFFIWFGKRAKLLAFVLLSGLQLLIYVTGNHGFFNFLSFGLCILLLDDATLQKWMPRFFAIPINNNNKSEGEAPHPHTVRERLKTNALSICAIALVSLLAINRYMHFSEYAPGKTSPIGRILGRIDRIDSHWHVVNAYGLYQVVYETRKELVLLGSNDGQNWLPYQFKYKIQDPKVLPPFVEPLQPRLDWRIRFAAAGPIKESHWYTRFLVKVLSGSPDVLSLMGPNPFPNGAPKYLKADLYKYAFTSAAQHNATKDYWQVSFLGPFTQPFTLTAPTPNPITNKEPDAGAQQSAGQWQHQHFTSAKPAIH